MLKKLLAIKASMVVLNFNINNHLKSTELLREETLTREMKKLRYSHDHNLDTNQSSYLL